MPGHWKTWATIGIVAVFLDDWKDLIVAAVKKVVEAEYSEGKMLYYGKGKTIPIISALLLAGADESKFARPSSTGHDADLRQEPIKAFFDGCSLERKHLLTRSTRRPEDRYSGAGLSGSSFHW